MPDHETSKLFVSAAYRLLRNTVGDESARAILLEIAAGDLIDLPAKATYVLRVRPPQRLRSDRDLRLASSKDRKA